MNLKYVQSFNHVALIGLGLPEGMMQTISQLSRLGFLISIVLIISLSGCLGTFDDILEETDIEDIAEIPFEDLELPTGWNKITERTTSSPYLVPFNSC